MLWLSSRCHARFNERAKPMARQADANNIPGKVFPFLNLKNCAPPPYLQILTSKPFPTFSSSALRRLHDLGKNDRESSMSDGDANSTPIQNASATISKLQRQYQQILDRWTPHVFHRWMGTAGLVCLFLLRVLLSQGVSWVSFNFFDVCG
jgi:hypothetical protein